MSEILAVIPAYNAGSTVGAVVAGARRYLPVLVVDDGSSDATAAEAAFAGAQVLNQQPNQGKGAALRAGFRQALEGGYAAVITLDADAQHDTAEIPKFLQAYASRQADIIIGARDFRQMPWSRRLANIFGRWSFSWALGQPVPDNQSGYRLISRRMMEAMLDSCETGFEFEVEMIVTCVLLGYRLDWVPVRTIYTPEGSHIKPLKHTVNWFRQLWQTRRRVRTK